MRKNNVSQKAVSVLLSVLMVFAMIPVFTLASSAEDEATLPASISGEWVHQLVEEGNYAGYGENYVSMWVKNTDFVFMQTKDNETFKFSFEFWAMKNDGVNTAYINDTEFKGMSLDSSSWASLTPTLAGDIPDGCALPGAVGSGNSNQYKNNLLKWEYTGEFTCNAPAAYNPSFNVSYRSGATGVQVSTHSLAGDGEEVVFTVTVVNLRELLAKLASAQDAYENDSAFTEEEKAALAEVINNINNNYVLDGTVAYSQEEIDGLCAQLEAVTGSDVSAYREAVARAEDLVNSPIYSDEIKAPVKELLAKKDTILAMTVHQQSEIDAAAEELNKAVDEAIKSSRVSLNGIDSENPATPGVFTFDSSKDNDNANNWDTVSIQFNYSDIYMDISENLSDMGLKYSMSTYFANEFDTAAPVTNSLATTSNICGEANKFNFGEYFAYTTDSSSTSKAGDGNSSHSYKVTASYDIPGATPLKTTSADGEKVYVGAYWIEKKTSLFGGYTYYSTDGNIFTTEVDQPYFTLHVYDKSELGETLSEAYELQDTNAANILDFVSAVNAAKTVYGTRVTTQAEIDAAVKSINDFVFEYKVDASASNGGTVEQTLVSGTDKGNNVYVENSVVTLTATPGEDYDFVSWSNGSKETSFDYTVTDSVNFTANFVFVPANTENLENAISDASVIDETKYSPESVQALNEAIEKANELVNADPALGKSHQDEIDAAESELRAAVENLQKTNPEPCDYSLLDEAIASSDEILGTIPENNGKYKQDVWQEFIDCYENAKDIDRNLTDENPENQRIIDEAAIALAEAISALNDPENQNDKVDTTALENTKNDAEDTFGDTNDGTYTDDAWQEYTDAIKDAKDIIDNAPEYDNEDGEYQEKVDAAIDRIEAAIEALENPDNQNYKITVTDENGDVIATVLVKKSDETTFGSIKDQIPDTASSDERYVFAGWKDSDGNTITDDTVLNVDMTLSPVFEISVFVPIENANIDAFSDSETGDKFVGTEYYFRTVDELTNQFVESSSMFVIYRNGVALSANACVRTGDIIKYIDAEGNVLDEAYVVLYGDVNGDGAIDAFDAIEFDFAMNTDYTLTGVYAKAADAIHDNSLDANDYKYIEKFARGC